MEELNFRNSGMKGLNLSIETIKAVSNVTIRFYYFLKTNYLFFEITNEMFRNYDDLNSF